MMRLSIITFFAISCVMSCTDDIEPFAMSSNVHNSSDTCLPRWMNGGEMDSFGRSNQVFRLKQKIDSLVQDTYAFKHLNGCMLVNQKGVDLLKFCQGKSCLKCKEATVIDSATTFQLASLSKTFTAIATMQLVDRGMISLEDSVAHFYPGFPYPGVTIKSLLSHRSGLPNYMYVFNDSMFRSKVVPDNQLLMQWFEREKPDRYNLPNRSFSYNNSNYAVLAAIIEQVSGLKFAEYLKREIFDPLQMTQSGCNGALPDSSNYTVGHEGMKVMPTDYFDKILGDKGIYSCMHDLKKWYLALNGTCLLKMESMKQVFSPQSFEYKGFKNYGLGFRMVLEKDQKTVKHIYHNGWWKGYNTLFWFSPKSNSFILVLSNVKNKGIFHVRSLIKILEPEDEVLDEEEREG